MRSMSALNCATHTHTESKHDSSCLSDSKGTGHIIVKHTHTHTADCVSEVQG